MEGSTQLLLSAASVAIAYYMFSKGKQRMQGSATNSSGADPSWNDPVVKGRKNQLDIDKSGGQVFPSCQIWSDTYQVFLDTGDASANVSQDACFSKYTDAQNARYTFGRGVGQSVYRRGTGVDEPAEAHGLCYFRDDPTPDNPNPTSWTKAPVGGVDPPPNWSMRLCFSAGETPQDAGRFFVKDNVTTFQPTNSYAIEGGQVVPPPRCESLKSSPYEGGTIVQWTYDPALPNDRDACMNASTAENATRWVEAAPWSPYGGTYLFKNPMTGKPVEIQAEVF